MGLISVEEASRLLLDGVDTLGSERVDLADAAYRALCGPVHALRTQPPFPCSAMDGYAIKADEKINTFEVIGESAAGRRFTGIVSTGQAVRIFTGAPVPEGADTVVMQEDVSSLGGNRIQLSQAIRPGRNVRRLGLDFVEGQVVVETGRALDPSALSLVAASGHAGANVVRRPRVVIIATGDELVPPGALPGPDQIVASNGVGISALARNLGAEVHDYGIVRDSEPLIRAQVERALSEAADIIVTLGGASVGDHDLVRPVLAGLGISLDFWKIAMRPGKPLMYGRSGAAHILGLPGNPVSSLVCGQLFLAPLIWRLAGLSFSHDIRQAKLSVPMRANDLRQDYVRARIDESENGLAATPFDLQDSSMLTTLANARGLIIRPPFAPELAVNAPVPVLMLR